MKSIALICNVILFLFTCLVCVTDGLPTAAAYIVFTLWELSTLILSTVVISRIGAREGWLGLRTKRKALEERKKMDGPSSMSPALRIAAIVCNIVLIGFVCWTMADQYPHPKEPGFIEYVVLMVLTPILSMVVILYSGTAGGGPGFLMKRKASEK